jgi:hypothetical protein
MTVGFAGGVEEQDALSGTPVGPSADVRRTGT